MSSPTLVLSDLANLGESLISTGLENPGPLTICLIFIAGVLTSLGPCSLSMLPVTLAYLAGFKTEGSPLNKSLSFCSGIVLSLVALGSISGFIGRIYGQVPSLIPTFVAVLAIIMGLNLLGFISIPLPNSPDPEIWKNKVPKSFGPIAAGLAFGLASSPCSTPVLAVLLGWIAQSGSPFSGIILLASFGIGQVIPLLLAGTAAATIPKLLALRPIGSWLPPISGTIFIVTGFLTLLSQWA